MSADSRVSFAPAWTLPGERVLVTDKTGTATATEITTQNLRCLADVRDNIQSQLERKQDAGLFLTGLVGEVIAEGPGLGGATIADGTVRNKHIAPNALISYEKLLLEGKIQGSDFAPGIGIPYSCLDILGKIKASDLVGGIPASKLMGEDINSVGKVTHGEWKAVPVSAEYGGTGADLSTSCGVIKAEAGSFYADLIRNADIASDARISRDKLLAGIPGRVVVNSKDGTLSSAEDLGSDRVVFTDVLGSLSSVDGFSFLSSTLFIPGKLSLKEGGAVSWKDAEISWSYKTFSFRICGLTAMSISDEEISFNRPVSSTLSVASKRSDVTITSVGKSGLYELDTKGSGFVKLFTKSPSIRILGIRAGRDGERVVLANAGSDGLLLVHGSELARAPTILCPLGADISVSPGGSIELIFDSGDQVWRVIKS